MVQTQYAGLDANHSIKRPRVADRSGTFTVAGKIDHVLDPSEGCCQRLTLHWVDRSVIVTSFRQEGLCVEFRIAVIARVYIQIGISTREHDEYIALLRASDPQC